MHPLEIMMLLAGSLAIAHGAVYVDTGKLKFISRFLSEQEETQPLTAQERQLRDYLIPYVNSLGQQVPLSDRNPGPTHVNPNVIDAYLLGAIRIVPSIDDYLLPLGADDNTFGAHGAKNDMIYERKSPIDDYLLP